MTSIGTGYDLSASTYSPDGRIFQVCPWNISKISLKPTNPLIGGICEQGSRELWVFLSLYTCYCTSNSSFRTAIGLRVKDGIVLAVEKLIHSKLLVPAANRRIQTIDKHIGLVRLNAQ